MEGTIYWLIVVFVIFAVIAQSLIFFLFFFEPSLRYKVRNPPTIPSDSTKFLPILEGITQSSLKGGNKIEVLTNAENYYEAEIEAIKNAKESIHLEAYIFSKGKVAKRFVEAMTERAQAGVEVRIVLDAIGSFATWDYYFKDLRKAGGEVGWYHPFRWFLLPRLNNRTHRELIIIDGRLGFIGGSGIADHWLYGRRGKPRWRDAMFRVEGEVVAGLQSSFCENWLEASGEMLLGERYFRSSGIVGKTDAMVVDSTPSVGRSTRTRMLFQTLLAAAKESIFITSPYFLPDFGARAEMIRAVKERNVDVKVIVPGTKTDHLLTRRSSRRLYGDLLKAGVKIYEYRPSMIHTKTMIVDGVWSVVGTTNFDSRSFSLNDEVNLVVFDEAFAHRVYQDFADDLAQSQPISYDSWLRRSWTERLHEMFGRILERQQ